MLSQFLQQRDMILAYLLAQTGDLDVAEEVFQEVGIVVVQESQRGTEVKLFSAWIREVSRRRLAEFYRKRNERGEQFVLSGAMADVVDQAFAENAPLCDQQQTMFKKLKECVEQLKRRAREVIQLRYYEEKDNAQIAKSMNWTVPSVRVALSRARKLLSECVQRKMRSEESN